jgi:hypothetical protein
VAQPPASCKALAVAASRLTVMMGSERLSEPAPAIRRIPSLVTCCMPSETNTAPVKRSWFQARCAHCNRLLIGATLPSWSGAFSFFTVLVILCTTLANKLAAVDLRLFATSYHIGVADDPPGGLQGPLTRWRFCRMGK